MVGFPPLTVRRRVKEGKIAAAVGCKLRISVTVVERLLGEQRDVPLILYVRVGGYGQKEDLDR